MMVASGEAEVSEPAHWVKSPDGNTRIIIWGSGLTSYSVNIDSIEPITRWHSETDGGVLDSGVAVREDLNRAATTAGDSVMKSLIGCQSQRT